MRKIVFFFILTIFTFHTNKAQNKSFSINDSYSSKFISTLNNDTISLFEDALRFREFIFNPVVKKNELINIKDTILLELFEDKHYTALIDKINKDVNGTFTIRARIVEFSYGYCIISTFEGKSSFQVDIPEKNEFYETRFNQKNNKHYLLEIDKSKRKQLEGAPPLLAPNDNHQNKLQNTNIPLTNSEIALKTCSKNQVLNILKPKEKESTPAVEKKKGHGFAVYGIIMDFNGKADEDSDGYYETFDFNIGIDGDAYDSSIVYMKIICTTNGQYWWSSSADTIAGITTDLKYFSFNESMFNGIGENTSLDFSVELWNSNKTTRLASNDSVTGEPLKVDYIGNGDFSVDALISDFNGGKDEDFDGYYETFSFNIGINGDAYNDTVNKVFMKIICLTTGQIWWSSNKYTILGSLIDYNYFSFDEKMFTGISGETNLDFTVELWDSTKTIKLALNEIVTGEPVKVEPQFKEDIALMIVYTPAASSFAEDIGSHINLIISRLMAISQLVIDNSNALINLELVHSEEVNYVEINPSVDLGNLRNTTDGNMDNVHILRDVYGADLVVLLEVTDEVGGLGYLLTSETGYPESGFSLSRVQQAAWTYTTIHEIGHNMGLHHHKEQNFHPGPGVFSYSAGWRWEGADEGKYCSVMTYQSGESFEDGIDHQRVAYFSNPNISYEDVATGDELDADNARTLREMRSVIAAYIPNKILVSNTYINLASFSGSKDSVAVSSNVNWRVSADVDWLNVSRVNNSNYDTLIITTSLENTQNASRSGTITVSGKGVVRRITVSQAGTDPVLSINPTSVTLESSKGSETEINVSSNISWNISKDADWLTISPVSGSNNGAIKLISNTENTQTLNRMATVTIAGGGLTRTFLVTQINSDRILKLNPTDIYLASYAGSSEDVEILSNLGRYSWYTESDADWLNISPRSGSVSGTLLITSCSENTLASSRSATVTISEWGGLIRMIKVTQAGKDPSLIVNPKEIILGANSGEGEQVNVSSNINWSVSADADWLNVSPISGSYNGKLMITSNSENTLASCRTATVTILGEGLSSTIDVTQAGTDAILSVNPYEISFNEYSGTEESIEVSSNVDWKVSSDANWLAVSPRSGSNMGSVTVTTSIENTSDFRREATLIFEGGGLMRTTKVTQAGTELFLRANPLNVTLDSTAGLGYPVNVYSNNSWNVSTDSDWLSISPSSGSYNGTIIITPNEENPSAVNRNATVTISGSRLSQSIMVTQAGSEPIISVNPTHIELASSSGLGETVDIASNVSWSVSNDADWLSIWPLSGSNNRTISISTSLENPVTSDRTSDIIITGEGSIHTISLTQVGADPVLNVNPNEVIIESASGSKDSVLITSNVDWIVSNDTDWVTVSPMSGSNDGTIFITTDSENTSASVRSATVKISGGGIEINLAIIQLSNLTSTLDDSFESSNILIYPNPTNDKISIVFKKTIASALLIEIIDVNGKKICSKRYAKGIGNCRIEFDLSSNMYGVYFIRLKYNGTTQTNKIILME